MPNTSRRKLRYAAKVMLLTGWLITAGCGTSEPPTNAIRPDGTTRPRGATVERSRPAAHKRIVPPPKTMFSGDANATTEKTDDVVNSPQPASPSSAVVEPTSVTPPAPSPSTNSLRPTIARQARFIPNGNPPPSPEVAPYQPGVVFSEEHRKLCLVGVGDSLADVTCSDLAGEPKRLGDLLEGKLTVVVFWNDRWVFGREQFDRLPEEIARRFGGAGVDVIAVNTGDSLEHVKQIAGERSPILCLADPNGEAFAKIATGKLPRTYLLDRQGQVLWLDIEYSRYSRRELQNALHFFLTSKP